jgi:hypothetical protein
MLFLRKKTCFNVSLERAIFFKIGKMNYDYYSFESKKSKYTIKSIIRNVPIIQITENKVIARVSYNEIPDTMVHFIIHINNVQKDFISSFNTINVFVKAKIDVEKEICKKCKFELLPIYERRALACSY